METSLSWKITCCSTKCLFCQVTKWISARDDDLNISTWKIVKYLVCLSIEINSVYFANAIHFAPSNNWNWKCRSPKYLSVFKQPNHSKHSGHYIRCYKISQVAYILHTAFWHLFSEKCDNFNPLSPKFVHKSPVYNKPALVQVMAWHRAGDKPLSEPVIAVFTDTYIGHSASAS